MLTRALQSHQKPKPPTATTAISSSSPPQSLLKNTTQISLAHAFSSSSSSSSKPDVMGPSGQHWMNSNPPPAPRRRSFSQQRSGLTKVFDPGSAFQENVPPPPPPVDLPKDHMSALHDAVYFDEADFDDDCDLDFDISEPIINPALAALPTPPQTWHKSSQSAAAARKPPQPAAATKKTLPPPQKRAVKDLYANLKFEPRLPPNQPLQQNKEPDSSQQLPWSSSPPGHLEPLKRQSVVEPMEEKTKWKKARTIPWAKEEQEPELRAPPASRTARLASKASTRKLSGDGMPWNDSFSNVEAKREARKRNSAATKQQKRTLTTTTEDSRETRKARKGKEPIAKIFLSEEQKRVIEIVSKEKQSVFFTGSAGTGKSVLLRELIAELKKTYSKDSDAVAVTASTGLAACNIGGVTLHSFAGIGLGKEDIPDLVRKIRRNQKAKTRWIRTKILIMDEISMVDGDLFDKLEAIARQIRNNGRPFGGIQLVITGDFFQLPPVPEGGRVAKFAFDANSWSTCIGHTIGLTQVFRQRDPEFARMLNEMRLGKLSRETTNTFRALSRPIEYDDGIQAAELFSTRSEVDASNNAKMQQLPGEAVRFTANDTGTAESNIRTKLLAPCMAPPTINLKVHSQVMLIKNVDDSLVNGSLGRVVGFMSEKSFDLLTEDDNGNIIRPEKEKEKKGEGDSRRWPLVQFAMLDGTTRQLLCQPEIWKVELPNGEIQAQRSQVPLILAWALSIHKAQGQTLERVKVDLGKVFEKGQAYVALSRATCKEGLQVLRFNENRVMAHERVRRFYESLYSAAEAAKRGSSSAVATVAAKRKEALTQTRLRKEPRKVVEVEVVEEEDYGFDDEEVMMEMQRGMF